MPFAIFDYIGAFLRNGFAHVGNITPVIKTIIWPLLSKLQGKTPHRNSPEPSESCLERTPSHAGSLRNPPEPRPTRAGTFRNPPEPSKTFRNQTFGTFRNLPPEPTPAHARTLRNLPEPASGTYTSIRRNPSEPSGTRIRRNSPEPSRTRVRNLHQHTGTFRNRPPEPTPTYAGTLRNLPEPASGTYTSTRRNSPERSGTFLRNLLLRPAPAHTGAYLG